MSKILAILAASLLFVPAARAHYRPGLHNTLHAINWGFCHHSYRPCEAGVEATRVADCETGGTFDVWAANGQFLGLFQMGKWARQRYGHANNAWGQAAAADRYYTDSGWSGWQCSPYGGLSW